MEKVVKIWRKATQKVRKLFKKGNAQEGPVYVFESGVDWDMLYTLFKKERNERLRDAVQELMGLNKATELEYSSLYKVFSKLYEILQFLSTYSTLKTRWNLVLIQLAVSKMDPKTQKGWSTISGSHPTLDLLIDYIFGIFQFIKEQDIYFNPQPGPSGYSQNRQFDNSEYLSSDDDY